MRNKNNEIILLVVAFIIAAFLVYFSVYHPEFIADSAFSLLALGLFYLLQRKYPLKRWLVIVGSIPLVLNMVGLTFGFFAFQIGGFGYDKMLHIFNALICTIFLFYWIMRETSRGFLVKLVIVILMVMGICAINEIGEFIGDRYFQVNGPQMFSQGDLVPDTVKNEYVRYDTSWDMIMDLIGTILAAIGIIIVHRIRRKRAGNTS